MKQKVVNAAIQLFAAQGYDGTSIQSIADAVGIRKQSLLYYFSTKEELRDGVLSSIFGYWNDVVPRALVEATNQDNRFESALRVVIDFFKEDPDRARLVLREALDRPAAMERLIQENFDPWFTLITNFIERGQRHGTLRRDLDPTSYVIHCIIIPISILATGGLFSPLFEHSAALETVDKLLEEYMRSARVGLFSDPSTPSKGSSGNLSPE